MGVYSTYRPRPFHPCSCRGPSPGRYMKHSYKRKKKKDYVRGQMLIYYCIGCGRNYLYSDLQSRRPEVVVEPQVGQRLHTKWPVAAPHAPF